MTFFTNIPILDGPFWCLENLAGSYQFNYTCAKQGTESAEMRLPVVEPRSQTFPRLNWNGSLGITDELSQCKVIVLVNQDKRINLTLMTIGFVK